MKYRVIDLLQSIGGANQLRLGAATKVTKLPFNGEAPRARCRQFCGFKNCPIQSNATTADCDGCYAYEIEEGELIADSGERYPIIGGIPRLLSAETKDFLQKNKKSFSLEWKYSQKEERNWGQDIEFRKQLFLQGFGLEPDALAGKLILDAGCGSGVLSRALGDSYGMEVLAADLATGIENAYRKNRNPHVHFIQASVLELPLKDRMFDYVYCAGVLIHLPDTKRAFDLLPRLLKPGGRMFIWVYHPIAAHRQASDRVRETIYQWLRSRVTSRLPIKAQEVIYLFLVVPFVIRRMLLGLLKKSTDTRTWREKMQNFIDTFSPAYVNRHTEEEVLEWYREGGFTNYKIAYSERYGFGARGDLMAAGDLPAVRTDASVAVSVAAR